MTEGVIFDLKKYSIHDGPGIRTTVFLKGCPLNCFWCHNPEGQSFGPELMVRSSRCLKECSACLSVCEPGALAKTGDLPILDLGKCHICGRCAEICPTQALAVVGRRVRPAEIVAEIEKDRIFYEQSGGGVTFSGGEPLAQPDFLAELLAECRRSGFHTVLDTCGYVPPETIKKIIGLVDLFLFDLKVMDEFRHREFTGQSNRLILENLRLLAQKNQKILIRLPIIPGVNDDDENTGRTVAFLHSLKTIDRISLLPYHKLGKEKYRSLQRENRGAGLESPSSETIRKIRRSLEEQGFKTSLGA